MTTDHWLQVRSFNFLSNSYLHLANQFYRACVRRERGYCRIAWTQVVCSNSAVTLFCTLCGQSGDQDSFKLSRPATNYNSNTGLGGCSQDSVKIPGGSDMGLGTTSLQYQQPTNRP